MYWVLHTTCLSHLEGPGTIRLVYKTPETEKDKEIRKCFRPETEKDTEIRKCLRPETEKTKK